jgi:hypothetical protein
MGFYRRLLGYCMYLPFGKFVYEGDQGMTFQLIKRDGKIKGLVVLFGEGRVVEIVVPRGEMWRICESCGAREALVFCRTHVKYICGPCLQKAPAVHCNCQFISMSVARELAEQAQKHAEVEA